jgi:hypothetical protein
MSNQAVWVTCLSKNKVSDVLDSSLKTRALVYSLTKLDNNLSDNTRLGSVDGQARDTAT